MKLLIAGPRTFENWYFLKNICDGLVGNRTGEHRITHVVS